MQIVEAFVIVSGSHSIQLEDDTLFSSKEEAESQLRQVENNYRLAAAQIGMNINVNFRVMSLTDFISSQRNV